MSSITGRQLADRTYRVAELPEQWDVLWFIQDRLVVVAPQAEPPSPDQPDVEVSIDIRLPYMQIAPMTYVGNKVTVHQQLVAH